jgi:predicted outer membrane repeat protein
LPFAASQNPYALVVYDPSAQPAPEPPAPLTWSDGLVLFFMALNLFATAAFYVINLMPKAFSYRLRLSGNFIRTFNIVMLNCIVMQGVVAQSFVAGKVSRMAMRTLTGEKTNQGGEGAGILVGGRSLAEKNVGDMNGLFNTVSNRVSSSVSTGNSIMVNGDTAILAVGPYKGSEGTCANSANMLYTDDLNGEVKCVEDNASCVLDGENARRGMYVMGTGSGTLILRALTIDKGYSDGGSGGGVYIQSGALVDFELIVFSNNRATDYGGGAIYARSSGTTVNIYGTSFSGNTADSGNGDDIYRVSLFGSGPTITIHNTCPSPYSSNTPLQGKTRMRIV